MLSNDFNHVVSCKFFTGKTLRKNDHVNALLFNENIAKEAKEYVKLLSLNDFTLENESTDTYQDLVDINYRQNVSTINHVKDALLKAFPCYRHFDAFAIDVFQTLKLFCDETDYVELQAGMIVSLPNSMSGIWHRDNDTDIRGFKAYSSNGPIIRSNSSLAEPWPEMNFYGELNDSDDKSSSCYQLREGDFGLWKGDKHPNPLIHVKPSTGHNEFRLSMIINPSENDYLRMCNVLRL